MKTGIQKRKKNVEAKHIKRRRRSTKEKIVSFICTFIPYTSTLISLFASVVVVPLLLKDPFFTPF